MEENTVEITGLEILNGCCPLCGDELEIREEGLFCNNAEGHVPVFEKILKEYSEKKDEEK